MVLPESVSQAARWALVVGLAFFAADTTAALLQSRLQVDAKALPPASVVQVQENIPAQAVPPGLVTLLNTTVPESKQGQTGPQGPSSNGGPAVKPALKKAPPNMKLQGTMAAGNGGGLAMIHMNGKTQVVGVGDQIGGLVLAHVSTYSVRLEGNGQNLILDMDSTGRLTSSAQATAPARPAPQKGPSQPKQPEPNQNQGDAGAILTQRELRNILDNPGSFAGKGFRMKPVLHGGEIVGMRVNITNQTHPLARLGIKNGDVIKSLNGTPLNGPEALSSIYRLLRNTSNLSFEVNRGGQPQKIDITLEE